MKSNYIHVENSHPTYTALDTVLPTDDKALMVRHSALKGIEISSLAAPPILLLASLLHPTHFRLAHFFHRQAFATYVLGGGIGFAVGHARTFNMMPRALHDRAMRLRMNDEQGREDEMTLIGAGMGAMTLPILLRGRVAFVPALLGGLSTGAALGVTTHLEKLHLDGVQSMFEGMIEEARQIWEGTDKMHRAKLSYVEEEADRFASGEAEKWSPRYEGI